MPATQTDRPFRLKTPLGDDALLVESFTGHEGVSRPYWFNVKALSDDPNIDMKGLLVQPAVLTFQLDDETERHVHSLVNGIKLLEYGEDGKAAYELELVPWLSFLTYFYNSRIFQNKSVPDIIEKIFSDRGYTDYRLNLQGSYNPREYCVQYRETDFNFISRLMEDEGIFYYFEQSEDKHTLVLADANSAFTPCPNMATARYVPDEGAARVEGIVAALHHEYHVSTGTASLTDYDFEKPNTDLFATLSGDQLGEFYDYPGGYITKDDGDRYARVRLEEREAEIATVRGRGTCMGFECGYKFTLEDHYRDETNQDYSILSLDHTGFNTSYRSGSDQKFEYSNSFEAIPNSVVYRPRRRTPKPVMKGTQTALVVGKSGEEIWVDKYGRVKVQFYWDREGAKDENSSCWIRVAQGWAGKQWGLIQIPRIGQEVLVTFLEGDPDRPLIAGSVYNADQVVPYTLPDEQTKSALKSYSSKGGGGFNEIRFEDKKGSEQIFVHGELNMDVRVKQDKFQNIDRNVHLVIGQDHYEHIKNDHHVTIDNDQVVKITRDNHLNIAGKQAIKVTGTHSFQVTGDVTEVFSGNHSEKTSMNLYIDAGMGIVIEGSTGITLKCGSNCVVIDPSGVTVKGSMIVLDGQMTRINSGPGSPAMSGNAGNPVSPTDPKAAQDADVADPGQSSQVQAQQKEQKTGRYGTIVPAAFHPPAPAPAGGGSSAAGAPAGAPPPEKTYIEIKLEDTEGKPVAGEAYKVTLPDGQTVAEGTLDDKGFARIDGVDPGSCKVTFPNMDKTVWDPK